MKSKPGCSAAFWAIAAVVFLAPFTKAQRPPPSLDETKRFWGRCETLPETSFCAKYGAKGGSQVWILDGMTMASTEARTGLLIRASSLLSTVGSSFCDEQLTRILCDMVFPVCGSVEGVEVPMQICEGQCQDMFGACAEGIPSLELVGASFMVPTCGTVDSINGTSRHGSLGLIYAHFLDQWEGRPIFQQEDTVPLTLPPGVNNGSTVDVGCSQANLAAYSCKRKRCVAPYVESSYSTSKSGDHESCEDYSEPTKSCTDCASDCSLACPLDSWSDAEWNAQWVARWLPGILSIPLNALVLTSELRKIKQPDMKRQVPKNTYLFYCAAFGLLYATLDAVPVMFFKFDMKCQGRKSHDAVTKDWHSYCTVGRFSIHVLQMLYASVFVVLQQLFVKLRAAAKLQQGYRQSRLSSWLSHLLIFGMPLTLLLAHALHPTSNGYPNSIDLERRSINLRDMRIGNYFRYGFACGPRFESNHIEWAIVMVPIIMLSTLLMLVSFALIKIVMAMGTPDISSGAVRSANRKINIMLARKMVRFALVCVLLAGLNLGAVVPFLESALEAGQKVEEWNNCAVFGVIPETCPPGTFTYQGCSFTTVDYDNLTATEARCGKASDYAPKAFPILLMHLSYSLPAFTFGILFGFPAFRELQKKRRKGRVKIGVRTTTVRTSSASNPGIKSTKSTTKMVAT
ncbi:Hypothetical protein SCF082_LOCUS32789 [Durusdinium trenchii]|uniref:FZ domain-containing protein n=1 Tax=Durusdinium trenchii TaxID=1381693 RepID=A0ABP0NK44_9DINO